MRRVIFLMLLMFVFLIVSVNAHAPDKITINFDEKTNVMTINVSHQVKSPTEHYIKEIEVYRNGKEIISQKFTSQPNANGIKIQYALPDYKKGDKYKVEAYCNKTGVLEVVFPK